MSDLPSLEQALERFNALEDGYLDIAERHLSTAATDIVVRYHLLDGCGQVTMSSTNKKLHFPDIPAETPGVYIFERWQNADESGEQWQAKQIYVGESRSIRTRWESYRNRKGKHGAWIGGWMENWLEQEQRQIRIRLVLWAQVRDSHGVVLAGRIPTLQQLVLRRLVEGAVVEGHQNLLAQEFELEPPLNYNPIAMKYEEDEILFGDVDGEA